MVANKTYNDIEYWNSWKKSGFKDKKAFRKLMKEIDPIIQSHVNKWAPPTLPRSAVEAKAFNLAVEALPKFDPSKGVKMNTYLTSRMEKLSRYVYKNQNLGHIPENRIMKVDEFNKSKSLLKDKLSREPNASEIADFMSIPIKEVERLEQELRKNVITTNIIDSHYGNTTNDSSTGDIIDFVYYELDPEEKLVYEYSLGKNGKPMLDGKAIAKKMKVSTAKISRIRKKIEKKIEGYLK